MRRKIGLLAGGIEQYWRELGMKQLPERLDADVQRLVAAWAEQFEVVYPGLAGNPEDAARSGRILRAEEVDLAVMYHATYLDDAMSLAFLDELDGIFPVLFQSQGITSFMQKMDLTDAGRSWGNNSAVQLPGTLKRAKPDLRFGYVCGGLTSAEALREIGYYARAAHAVQALRGKRMAFLPHLGEHAEEVLQYGFDFYETYRVAQLYKDRDTWLKDYGVCVERVRRPTPLSFDVDQYEPVHLDLWAFIPDKGRRSSVEHFARCYLTDERPQNADGRAGALSTTVALALLQSLEMGRPVALS